MPSDAAAVDIRPSGEKILAIVAPKAVARRASLDASATVDQP
jgi:hypothetical protein